MLLKPVFSVAVVVVAVGLSGCAATLKPSYTSTNAEVMRVSEDKPEVKAPEVVNMGSFCQEVTEKWKADGKTPDGQTVWSKDVLRHVVPCK